MIPSARSLVERHPGWYAVAIEEGSPYGHAEYHGARSDESVYPGAGPQARFRHRQRIHEGHDPGASGAGGSPRRNSAEASRGGPQWPRDTVDPGGLGWHPPRASRAPWQTPGTD